MERPGGPDMPCWPGIPRSPLKIKVGKELKIDFMAVNIYAANKL